MGRVDALTMPEVRSAKRCWVSVGNVDEDGVAVVRAIRVALRIPSPLW
jgi:hypothetical protein